MVALASLAVLWARTGGSVRVLAAPVPAGKLESAVLDEPDLSKKPAYWRDVRLGGVVLFPMTGNDQPRQEVLLRPETRQAPEDAQPPLQVIRVVGNSVLLVGDVLHRVSEETGVAVHAQADWGRDRVAVPRAGTPARELMDGLAAAYETKWFRFGKSWVLARTADEARLTLLTTRERQESSKRAVRALFTSLSGAQLQLLAGGGRLDRQNLTPLQQRAALDVVRLYFYDPDNPDYDRPDPTTLTGRGVYLTLSGHGASASIELWATGPTNPGYSFEMPFYDPTNGRLMWGVPPPR